MAVAKNPSLSAVASPEAVLKGEITPEQVDEAAYYVPLVEAWARRARKSIEAYLMNGGQLENAKIVAKKTNREWSDEEAVAEFLQRHGVEPYDPPKIKSPAAAEKLLTKLLRSELQDFVTKPEGAPTMAFADDPRPALSDYTALSTMGASQQALDAQKLLDRKAKFT